MRHVSWCGRKCGARFWAEEEVDRWQNIHLFCSFCGRKSQPGDEPDVLKNSGFLVFLGWNLIFYKQNESFGMAWAINLKW